MKTYLLPRIVNKFVFVVLFRICDTTPPACGSLIMQLHFLFSLFVSLPLFFFSVFLYFCSSALFQGMLLSQACVTLCVVAPSIMRMDSLPLLWLLMRLDMCKFVLSIVHWLQHIILIYCIYVPPFCLSHGIQGVLQYFKNNAAEC